MTHRYELVFDDGHHDFVDADGPTEAVRAIQGPCAEGDGSCGHRSITDCKPRPHTMTDLTAMREWMSRDRTPVARPVIDDSKPLRHSWRAKELM